MKRQYKCLQFVQYLPQIGSNNNDGDVDDNNEDNGSGGGSSGSGGGSGNDDDNNTTTTNNNNRTRMVTVYPTRAIHFKLIVEKDLQKKKKASCITAASMYQLFQVMLVLTNTMNV
jgi:hypothetical protein